MIVQKDVSGFVYVYVSGPREGSASALVGMDAFIRHRAPEAIVNRREVVMTDPREDVSCAGDMASWLVVSPAVGSVSESYVATH